MFSLSNQIIECFCCDESSICVVHVVPLLTYPELYDFTNGEYHNIIKKEQAREQVCLAIELTDNNQWLLSDKKSTVHLYIFFSFNKKMRCTLHSHQGKACSV